MFICNRLSNLFQFDKLTFFNQIRLLRILFYGSDEFSLETLKALHQNVTLPSVHPRRVIKTLDICTMSEKNLIWKFSKKNHIPIHPWPYVIDEQSKYNLGIVVSFGKLIPQSSIDACNKRILNVHASLLPKLRGASPIQRAILNDHSTTGVTIMKIAADKFDTGQVIAQKSVEIEPETKAIELYKNLAVIGSQLLMSCLENLENSLLNSVEQNDKEATKAPKIKKEEGAIDWDLMNANHIYKLFRAFDTFIPIYTHWINDDPIALYDMVSPITLKNENLDNEAKKLIGFNDIEIKPGFLFFHKKKKLICIRAAEQSWAAFASISLKNYKKVSALQFYNGFITKILKKNIENKFIILKTLK